MSEHPTSASALLNRLEQIRQRQQQLQQSQGQVHYMPPPVASGGSAMGSEGVRQQQLQDPAPPLRAGAEVRPFKPLITDARLVDKVNRRRGQQGGGGHGGGGGGCGGSGAIGGSG